MWHRIGRSSKLTSSVGLRFDLYVSAVTPAPVYNSLEGSISPTTCYFTANPKTVIVVFSLARTQTLERHKLLRFQPGNPGIYAHNELPSVPAGKRQVPRLRCQLKVHISVRWGRLACRQAIWRLKPLSVLSMHVTFRRPPHLLWPFLLHCY